MLKPEVIYDPKTMNYSYTGSSQSFPFKNLAYISLYKEILKKSQKNIPFDGLLWEIRPIFDNLHYYEIVVDEFPDIVKY